MIRKFAREYMADTGTVLLSSSRHGDGSSVFQLFAFFGTKEEINVENQRFLSQLFVKPCYTHVIPMLRPCRTHVSKLSFNVTCISVRNVYNGYCGRPEGTGPEKRNRVTRIAGPGERNLEKRIAGPGERSREAAKPRAASSEQREAIHAA